MLEFNTTFGQGHDGRIQLAGTAALVLSQRAADAQKKFVVNVQQAVQATEEAERAQIREEREQAKADREARQQAAIDAEVASVDPRQATADAPSEDQTQDIVDIVV